MGKNIKTSRIFNAFQESEPVLKRFLRRFTSNKHDIEDICQLTILRALEAEKTRDIAEPRAFLFGVSKNIVRKRLEKKSNSLIDYIEDSTPKEYVPSTEPSIDDIIDSESRMLVFTEAVEALPKQCRQVFVMKKVYGYSHKEIASRLGISISTTEKHVATGLKRCNTYIRNKLDINSSNPVSFFRDNGNIDTGAGK